MPLDDRSIIVTGAARGLGRDYARFFAEEGAKVAVADIAREQGEETAAEIVSAGGTAIFVPLDVTSLESAEAMARTVADNFGRIDGLINNAALWGDIVQSPLLEIDPDYWDIVMAVNLKGPLLCARAVAPYMKEQRFGRIINISSMGAYMPGGAYCVSKLALHQVTWQLAAELGSFGVTVNAVGPGPIYNEATRKQLPDPSVFERLVQGTLTKRGGTSKDIYGMLRYLMSDEAEWVTAQPFMVNGGFLVNL
jgi:NAD(P)-dependent dehydrogenase (short-subunit alcohol dehydrogenase family)